MKLKVTVQPNLYLTKERVTKKYNDVFEVSEERGLEILKATYKGKPVAELIEEKQEKIVRSKRKGEMKDEQKNERN